MLILVMHFFSKIFSTSSFPLFLSSSRKQTNLRLPARVAVRPGQHDQKRRPAAHPAPARVSVRAEGHHRQPRRPNSDLGPAPAERSIAAARHPRVRRQHRLRRLGPSGPRTAAARRWVRSATGSPAGPVRSEGSAECCRPAGLYADEVTQAGPAAVHQGAGRTDRVAAVAGIHRHRHGLAIVGRRGHVQFRGTTPELGVTRASSRAASGDGFCAS